MNTNRFYNWRKNLSSLFLGKNVPVTLPSETLIPSKSESLHAPIAYTLDHTSLVFSQKIGNYKKNQTFTLGQEPYLDVIPNATQYKVLPEVLGFEYHDVDDDSGRFTKHGFLFPKTKVKKKKLESIFIKVQYLKGHTRQSHITYKVNFHNKTVAIDAGHGETERTIDLSELLKHVTKASKPLLILFFDKKDNLLVELLFQYCFKDPTRYKEEVSKMILKMEPNRRIKNFIHFLEASCPGDLMFIQKNLTDKECEESMNEKLKDNLKDHKHICTDNTAPFDYLKACFPDVFQNKQILSMDELITKYFYGDENE